MLLGRPDELVGQQQRKFRMLPAQKCIRGGDTAVTGTQGPPEAAPDEGERQAPELQEAPPAGDMLETPDPLQPAASAWDLFGLRAQSTPGQAREETATLLALVAESLQVGAACLARLEAGVWHIVEFHDRAGMELRVGAPLPYSAFFGPGLARGTIPALIVENLRADARFMSAAADPGGRVCAITAVPLAWADGQRFGALCTLHPQARTVPSGEIPLLRLAGRMLQQSAQSAQALEREQQAARQAAVFAAMVEHSDDAIIGKSLGGQIETWNTGATRLYGYTAAEAIGRQIGLLAPPGHADELPSLLARIVRGERVDHFETVRMRKDGSRVDVSLTISPIRNGSGEIIAASTIARDITVLARARAEQDQACLLAEELARFRQEQAEESAIVAAVADAFVGSLELPAVYAVILEQAARLVPYDFAGVMEHEDDWAVVQASSGPLAVAPGTRYRLRAGSEKFWKDAPGAAAAVLDTAQEPAWQGVDPEAGPLGLHSVLHVPLVLQSGLVGSLSFGSQSHHCYTDSHIRLAVRLGDWAMRALSNAQLYASEQARARAAEELTRVRAAADEALRFQASLLDAVGQAVVALDLQGNITFWNRAAELLYGWPAAEARGRNAKEILITSASHEEAAQVIATLTRGESWSGKFTVRRRDGSLFPAWVCDTPVRDAAGAMIGMIGVSTDLSTRN